MLCYPVKLTKDGDQVMITCRALPEVITSAPEDEVAVTAADAIEEALAARIADREDIPMPGKPRRGEVNVAVPTSTELKVLLYRTMQDADVTKAKLARCVGGTQKQADRLLDVRHTSGLPSLDAAFAALGKRIRITLEDNAC